MFQPKTGAKCSCRVGIERDNCQHCEGTGEIIDFAAIRNNNREKAAMSALLGAHPNWSLGRRVSLSQAIKHRKVPRQLKVDYIAIMAECHPTSNFNWPAIPE